MLYFTKVADNAWDVTATDQAGNPLVLTGPVYPAGTLIMPGPAAGAARIQFNTDGSLMDNDAIPGFQMSVAYNPGGGAAPMNVNLDFSKVMQPALQGSDATSTLRALDYNGYPTGALTNISVDARGVITGYYTNGQFREVAQVAVANFFNPGGLVKEPNNSWSESPNSGFALIGAAGEAGRGMVVANSLEMSNVDISAEFTNMIITQRGFQANSRIITATDELLQEVVNLKR